MIYFCADDYGISAYGNSRIENCLENGVLNKISIIPNGEITDFKNRLAGRGAQFSLHINLVEGCPLSGSDDVGLLVSEKGYFKYSFIGLLLLSLSSKRKEVEKQVYKEIQSQINFWKETMGSESISIDSHQHTHMIPFIFKTLMRVIEDEGIDVKSIRIPAEPAMPYFVTPSLYFTYNPVGFMKQWLLKLFAFANRKEMKKANLKSAYFMGAMFSGKLSECKINKMLPRYLKLAQKNNRDIEIGFHPGFIKSEDDLIDGSKESFRKFYTSPWREKEYNTLLNLKFEHMKEGQANALH